MLVNEWGDVSLDSAIIDSQGAAIEIRDVSGGCICCTAGAAFEGALDAILQNVDPDRILIEPSGVAKPGDIIDLLRNHNQADRFDIRPVIGLVDPKRFLQSQILSMPLYRDQVEASQILVANRCDTADEKAVFAFLRKAETLYPPKVRVLTTSYGEIPLDALEAVDGRSIQASEAPTSHHFHTHWKATGPEFAQAGWIWPHTTCFWEKALNVFFESLSKKPEAGAPKLERVKGIFNTDRGWFLMEIAGNEAIRREIQYRGESRCQFIASTATSEELEIFKDRLDRCIRSAT